MVWTTYRGDVWHDVGRFHLADGTFTGYYANILTPVGIDGGDGFDTVRVIGTDAWGLDRPLLATRLAGVVLTRSRTPLSPPPPT